MRYVTAGFIVSTAIVAAQADESWFDGRWVLDRDATFAAWSEAAEEWVQALIEESTEGFEGKSPASLRASIDHARRLTEKAVSVGWDEQGEPELDVDSGEIAIRLQDHWSERVSYSMRPIEPGVFEVTSTVEGRQWTSVVRKTTKGFCRTFYGAYDEPLRRDSLVYSQECFKRHGT